MLLGLGMSGPQVVEGWHGVAYGKPLERTREYVEIVRMAIAREEPLAYDGTYYDIPYEGVDATGLGKPLKSILHPLRDRIPIYLAAIGPKNVALTAEIAEGWLPIYYSPEREDVFADVIADGESRRDADLPPLEIAATAYVAVGDDLDACRDLLRPMFALYVGGMGARGRTSTSTSRCATAGRTRRARSRTSTWRARRPRPPPRSPTPWSRRWRSSARSTRSRTGCRPGRRHVWTR